MADKVRTVTPGEKVGEIGDFSAGYGVCEYNGILVATLVGELILTDVGQNGEKGNGKEKKRMLSVRRGRDEVNETSLPEIGCEVIVKIVKVTPRVANAEIMLKNGRPMKELFKGIIRQQDVRQSEVDKVDLYKSFGVGDIVRAEVMSLGDRHHYLLNTAKNEYGVLYAKSAAGVMMVAVNWQEMQCPLTKTREFRKVAKAV